MANIKEIARRARVSIGTVSNVVNGTAVVSPRRKERVLAAIRELDYHPNHVARSLKLRTTRMLGMVISDITNPFFRSWCVAPKMWRSSTITCLSPSIPMIVWTARNKYCRF